MSKTWKAAESRIGAWLGAKGIKKSGRVPLSGGNSGETRSDSPHPTIFNEAKRDRSYHSVINYWDIVNEPNLKLKAADRIPTVLMLPTVANRKVTDLTSDLWCFHSSDSEFIVKNSNTDKISIFPWNGPYPSALTLYQTAYTTCKSGHFDKNKKVVCCSLVYHGRPGWWWIINKNDLTLWWECILEARVERERLLREEGLWEG